MQQMNAIAPGGIASMMRGMPQGMPQPKPQPAGIALSSIDEIANAQGTKTIPDGLKPLLALEQALSQVKAAQNQQMLQQQIPQGTIQDQYVSKADSVIQQAKEVAATSAEQERKKQAAAQQLIAGIAKAPGAQKLGMYAGGGIVAFQNRGEVPAPESQEERDRKAILAALEQVGMGAAKLAAAGIDVVSMPVRALAGIYNTLARGPRAFGVDLPFANIGQDSLTPVMDIITEMEAAAERPREKPPEKPVVAQLPTQGRIFSPAIDQAALDRVKRQTEQGPQFDIRQPVSPQLLANLQQQAGQVGPSERAGLERQIEKMRGQLPPAAPSGAVPGQEPKPGITQALDKPVMTPGAAGQGISPSPLEKAVEEGATAMMGMRPQTEIEAARKRRSETMDPALQAQRAEQERAYREAEAFGRPDPERRKYQAIAEMLRGYAQPIPGGGIGQFLMNAGAAGNRYSQAQQAQDRARMLDLQKRRAEKVGTDVKSAEELFKAGEEKYKPALEAGAAGVRAGTDLLTSRQTAATAAANRASQEKVAMAQIKANVPAQIQLMEWMRKPENRKLAEEIERAKGRDERAVKLYEQYNKNKLMLGNVTFEDYVIAFEKAFGGGAGSGAGSAPPAGAVRLKGQP